MRRRSSQGPSFTAPSGRRHDPPAHLLASPAAVAAGGGPDGRPARGRRHERTVHLGGAVTDQTSTVDAPPMSPKVALQMAERLIAEAAGRLPVDEVDRWLDGI